MQVPPFSLNQQIDNLGVDLEEAVLEVLRSGQYIGGPQVKRFEEAFAACVGCEHAVGCNSGTDALILALRGRAGPGSERRCRCCSPRRARSQRMRQRPPRSV